MREEWDETFQDKMRHFCVFGFVSYCVVNVVYESTYVIGQGVNWALECRMGARVARGVPGRGGNPIHLVGNQSVVPTDTHCVADDDFR